MKCQHHVRADLDCEGCQRALKNKHPEDYTWHIGRLYTKTNFKPSPSSIRFGSNLFGRLAVYRGVDDKRSNEPGINGVRVWQDMKTGEFYDDNDIFTYVELDPLKPKK